jgi:hypothetical protein
MSLLVNSGHNVRTTSNAAPEGVCYWNYTMFYIYMNIEEVQPYFDMFDKICWKRSEQPILK